MKGVPAAAAASPASLVFPIEEGQRAAGIRFVNRCVDAVESAADPHDHGGVVGESDM